MDMHAIMYRAVFICFMLAVCSVCAHANDDVVVALWPDSNSMSLNQVASQTDDDTSYINRIGNVSLDVNLFFPISDKTGVRTAAQQGFSNSNMSVSFFPDEQYIIYINSESRPQEDILSLNGHILDHELGTFSMTITSESFLITLQDMNKSFVYRVIGDTETGHGQVTEIDLPKMPPILYSPPM